MLAVIPFSTEAEALEIANDSDSKLSAGNFTNGPTASPATSLPGRCTSTSGSLAPPRRRSAVTATAVSIEKKAWMHSTSSHHHEERLS